MFQAPGAREGSGHPLSLYLLVGYDLVGTQAQSGEIQKWNEAEVGPGVADPELCQDCYLYGF